MHVKTTTISGWADEIANTRSCCVSFNASNGPALTASWFLCKTYTVGTARTSVEKLPKFFDFKLFQWSQCLLLHATFTQFSAIGKTVVSQNTEVTSLATVTPTSTSRGVGRACTALFIQQKSGDLHFPNVAMLIDFSYDQITPGTFTKANKTKSTGQAERTFRRKLIAQELARIRIMHSTSLSEFVLPPWLPCFRECEVYV